ncbi:MAG TPA: TRAP transporter substrate-binding protein DctP [Ferrovibrio sp.]|uniref:TRAP transporter substrate-binding protein n=1 Tax=Ferrovibrio sp. TaxID=1917215 RepID=UPI002ED0EFFA
MLVAGQAKAEPVKLRVADSFPTGHYIGEKITKVWMSELTKRSNGAVTFEYYPAEQLGKVKDMLTLTQSGVTDIGYVPPSFVTDKMPLSAVAELPASFTESCQGTMAYFKLAHGNGILAKQEFAPLGIHLLFTIVLPPYQVFLGKKDIEGLKTFEGLKIRSSGGAKELAVRKLSAVPISMSTPEVYEALSRGTIDGMLFPYSSIYSYDLQGLLKSATIGENFGSFVVNYVISDRRWKALPPDVRKLFDDMAEETSSRACKISQAGEVADQDRLRKAGVHLVTLGAADKAAVRKHMSGVNAEWAQALDKRGKPGTQVLKAFEEALQ